MQELIVQGMNNIYVCFAVTAFSLFLLGYLGQVIYSRLKSRKAKAMAGAGGGTSGGGGSITITAGGNHPCQAFTAGSNHNHPYQVFTYAPTPTAPSRLRRVCRKIGSLFAKKSKVKSSPVRQKTQLSKQWWHQRTLKQNFVGSLKFFRDLSSSCRISNLESPSNFSFYGQKGRQVSVHKLILSFPRNTAPEEIQNVLEEAVLTIYLGDHFTQSFLIPEKVDGHEAIYDIGLVLNDSQTFHASLDFDYPAPTLTPLDITMVVESSIQQN